MIDDKRDIIISEGVSVEVYGVDYAVSTIAIIGRASTSTATLIALESHRRANFLPEVPLPCGSTVYNNVTNERYVIISTFDEVLEGEKAATVCIMYLCNAALTVSSIVEDADEDGNITQVEIIKYGDVPVHIAQVNADLRQMDPGLSPDAEYVIYMTGYDLDILDKFVVKKGSRELPLKVLSCDYFVFDGAVQIQAATETRRQM